jgi:hypothetical protein
MHLFSRHSPILELLMGTGEVQTIKEPIQLLEADPDGFICRPWPLVKMLLQSFVPQAESVLVPIEDLDHVAPSVTENEQIAGERIKGQMLLDQYGKSIDLLSHIRHPDCKVDLAAFG